MDNVISEFDFLSPTEIDHLRNEAMKLYDHCLVEGNPLYMMRFIERQLTYSPPRLELLRGIADDLQQRLFTLRESHFNVREKVITTFLDIYEIDVTSVIPANQLDTYHEVNPQLLIDYVLQHGINLGPEEINLLLGMIKTSRRMATQLQADINLTSIIREMIFDWLNALSIRFARFDLGWIVNDYRISTDEVIH